MITGGRSCEKLKTPYLFFRMVHDHQTWQIGDFWWEELTYRVTWSFLARSLATKFGKLVNHGEVKKLKRSHLLQTHWSHEVMLRTKNQIFLPHKTYDHQTMQGADVWYREAHHKAARLWLRDRKRSCIKLNT